MNVTEEINGIAVALCKSENMRVTAGQKYAALWRFVTTPGTDGAQQVIDAGHEPTQYGLWEMIIAHPSYPNKLGTSFSEGKRLLSIGDAPDPWQAEREERQAVPRRSVIAGRPRPSGELGLSVPAGKPARRRRLQNRATWSQSVTKALTPDPTTSIS